MHTVVSVKKPIGSAITRSPRSCLLHVAPEGLPLVDRDVGISYQGRELVASITRAQPLVTPVKWHADVVDGAAVDREHAHPPRHEGLGANAATRRRDRDPVGVADAFLGGQLRADLDEKLRLKLGEPDRKSTRLNSSHSQISYAVFCLKKKNDTQSSRFEQVD